MKKIITLMLLLVVAMTSVTMSDARTKRRGRTKAKTEQTAGLTALERKYGHAELQPLDDAAERAAHDEMCARI